MKKIYITVCLVVLSACNAQTDQKTGELKLDNEKARLGYAAGVLTDMSAFKNTVTEYREALLTGINDGLDGVETRLGDEDAAHAAEQIANTLKEKQKADFKKLQAKNKIEGDKFLLDHAKKKGVIVTESGLQYEIIKAGNGAKPGFTDDVRVLYDGKLIDGTNFNPYHKPDEVAKFALDSVIKGWAEALQLMSVGSKYRFILPPALAFGESGGGSNIPPNAVMIFDIELLAIEKHKSKIQKSGNYTLEIER